MPTVLVLVLHILQQVTLHEAAMIMTSITLHKVGVFSNIEMRGGESWMYGGMVGTSGLIMWLKDEMGGSTTY